MKKKKIVLFVFLIVGVLSLILTYKFKQSNLSKNKPVKEEKLSIMIKEQGATDYTKSSSKDIPKGDYVLNEEKSYCKNNGKIEGYDNIAGTVSFAFIGTDRCFLYFDFKQETIIIGTNELVVNSGKPDFTKTSITNEGIYKEDDDLGTSYYFRGAVDNNWVKFGKDSTGKDIYWRIIRINGDGSIRLIYTGTTAPTESQKVVMLGNNTKVATSVFNSSDDAFTYITYVPSTIRGTLDNWYKATTLEKDSSIKALVSQDQIFCSDMSATTTGSTPIKTKLEYNNYYEFGANIRLEKNKNPALICPTESDKYTSKKSSIGNNSLYYPVGLITADEVSFAGGVLGESNIDYYLYTGQNYWTGSPSFANQAASGGWPTSFNASIYEMNSNGKISYTSVNQGSSYVSDIRPVISLSSEAKLTGDGTWNNVYEVEKMGYETILANNGGKDTIEAKGNPDFTKVATTNEGMYATDDDYTATTGMKSYYFRGAVDNNWVQFGKDSTGKDIYWRIIRINGDGSIRLIYTGTTAPTESTKVVMTGTGTQINATSYAFNSSDNKAEHVGYMYTTGEQHGNSTSSDIKTTIENWYVGTTLKDNSLVSQDQIFCNDRSVTDGTWSSSPSDDLFYAPYTRLSASTPSPQLSCPTESDKFTSKKSSIGNKVLEYPVGLITADELAMAGGKSGSSNTNSSYYLYTNQKYWLGSPCFFISDDRRAMGFYVNYNGSVDTGTVSITRSARPVVSLSSKVKLLGNGTWNNPYVVEN